MSFRMLVFVIMITIFPFFDTSTAPLMPINEVMDEIRVMSATTG